MGSNSSRQQQVALAILPKISSTLSVIGSSLILAECLYYDIKRLKRVYNRLLCIMALFDVMESIWNFASTWAIPPNRDADSSVAFATGNHNSCQTQGFFLQLGIVIPILNAGLSTYYLLVIRYSWSETKIKKKAEPYFYAIAMIWGFGTALVGIPLDLYGSSGSWCWISSDKNLSRYVLYFIPLFLCFLIIAVSMWMLSSTVRRLENASKKYLSASYVKRLRKKENAGTGTSSRFRLRRSPREMEEGNSSTGSSKSRFLFKRRQHSNNLLVPDSDAPKKSLSRFGFGDVVSHQDKKETVPTVGPNKKPIGILGNKRYANDSANDMKRIMELKRSVRVPKSSSAKSLPLAVPEGNKEPCKVSNLRRTVRIAQQTEDFPAGPNDGLRASVNSMDGSTTGFMRLFSRSSEVNSNAQSFMRISFHSTSDKLKKKSKSKQVTEQALMYVLCFVLTFIWSFIVRGFDLWGCNVPPFIKICHVIFDPLQGFTNYFVYIRPKLISYRKKFPTASLYQRLKAIVTHCGIDNDADKEAEESAKQEISEWRRMEENMPAGN